MIDVHQCPRCELKFANRPELQDHFRRDHHADPETFSRYRYSGRADQPPKPEGKRYLVVANQTLQDDQVTEAVLQRAHAGPARFVVLVPATHSAHLASPPVGSHPEAHEPGEGDDAGLALARFRLRSTVDRLQQAGVAVEGRIGHPDPAKAVADVVNEEPVDEILLSTLPPGRSSWLQAELPGLLAHRFNVPVTHLVARA